MHGIPARRRTILVATVAGLAVGLTACGGQAASTTPSVTSATAPASGSAVASVSSTAAPSPAGAVTVPTISEADFQTGAAALCTANAQTVRGAFMAMSKPPTPEQMQQTFDTLVAESYKISDDLAALGAPAERQAALAAVIETNDRITAAVETAGPAAFFGSQEDAYAELYPLMQRLQVPACLPQES